MFMLGLFIGLWIGWRTANKHFKPQNKVAPKPVESESLLVGNTIAYEAIRRSDIYRDFLQQNLLESGLNASQVSDILLRLENIVVNTK